jgi:hypothetical protein
MGEPTYELEVTIMKSMKKNVRIRIICLAVAMTVLSGSVALAAVLGSPYETLKNSILDALTLTNPTVEAEITTSVNGVVVEVEKSHYVVGDDATLRFYFDAEGNPNGWTYNANGLSLNRSYTSYIDSSEWYSADVWAPDGVARVGNSFGMTEEERNSSSMRFYELLIDTLVGDLKNLVTMSPGPDGSRIIKGTLTESQVPELAKAALDMLADVQGGYYGRYSTREISFDGSERVWESVNINGKEKIVTTSKQPARMMTADERKAWEDGTFWDEYYRKIEYSDDVVGYEGVHWGIGYIDDEIPIINLGPDEFVSQYTVPATRADYGDNPFDVPMKSIALEYAHFEATVDADGNLTSLKAEGTARSVDIFGGVNIIEIKVNLKISDIGTTVAECPIPGAKDLLTLEWLGNKFGNELVERWTTVYYMLGADGRVDPDSITLEYPGAIDASIYKAQMANPYLYGSPAVGYAVPKPAGPEYDTDIDGGD